MPPWLRAQRPQLQHNRQRPVATENSCGYHTAPERVGDAGEGLNGQARAILMAKGLFLAGCFE